MTIFEFGLTYLVSWWIVLFMVLPFWIRTAEKPEIGHAPSAPAHPYLKRKFWVTTALAFVPTLILMFAVSAHAAESGIYTTKSSKCAKLKAYTPPADLKAEDKDATLNPQSAIATDSIPMNLDIPAAKYLNADKYNADFSETQLQVGKIEVKQDGSATLNGKAIGSADQYSQDCKDGE